MMPLNYLADMTFKQVERLSGRTELVFFPVAPTEVHGTHLPMSVDVLSAQEITDRAATKLAGRGVESLIAPALNYCLADVANSFPGNITMRFETVAAVVEDICLGLAKWGFRRILVVCGHAEGRNLEAISEGLGRATARGELTSAVSRWFVQGLPRLTGICREAHPEWDWHAGEWETALVLMRRPDLVDHQELRHLEPNWEGEHLRAAVAAGGNDWLELGAPLAYFGDPRLATVETGERVYDLFSDLVVEEALALRGQALG